jgi:microsomal dipeptidase-like Zn-dependent dipeptidase
VKLQASLRIPKSDFTRCTTSTVRLIAVSLYPPESGFFEIPNSTTFDKIIELFGLKHIAELELGYIVSSFSKSNIERIKADEYDYFQELLNQVTYITATTPYKPDPAQCVGTTYSQIKNASYTILNNGTDLQLINSDPVIQIFLNVEGGNSLWSNITFNGNDLWNGRNFNVYASDTILQNYQVLNSPDFRNRVTKDMVENNPGSMNQLWSKAACDMVLQNLQTLISKVKLFSFTFAHHFYNGLCGHCESLQPITDLGLADQSFGINSDITHLGFMVINELLKNNILVDVKHMSWKARQSYYRFRTNNYPTIPVIASHAAVSGRKAMGDTDSVDTWNPNPFYKFAINLYDDDIYETVRSNGLIGIEFDQRVNGVKDSGINTLWKNFQYIAERVATTSRTATQTVWDNICLGTDFDGVIHPVDEFQTYDDMGSFEDFLLQKITDYMKHPPANFQPQDLLDPTEILAKLCFKNVVSFVKKNFK